MGIAHQLKLLAPVQVKCRECRISYVPFHKDVYREQCLWLQGEDDWLGVEDWIVDRCFQSNMRFCSPTCLLTWETREAAFQVERLRHKNSGKYR